MLTDMFKKKSEEPVNQQIQAPASTDKEKIYIQKDRRLITWDLF